MESSLSSMRDKKVIGEITNGRLQELTEKIKKINAKIEKQSGLGKEFKIGSAYFKGFNGDNLEDIWQHNIEPILREYMRGRQGTDGFIEKCENALKQKQEAANTTGQNNDTSGDE